MATSGEKTWPRWGEPMAVLGEKPMAIDSEGRAGGGGCGPLPPPALLKARGVNEPRLVIGDGALGTWAALRDVFQASRPSGSAPALRTGVSTARTDSLRSTGSGRSSRRFPDPAPISHSHRASLASCSRSPIFLRPARHYPRLWLRTPLGVGPTGLPPASNTASPARTTTASDAHPAPAHFPD